MPEDLYPANILVVTGSVPRAEMMDRPLAYYLKDRIDDCGGSDPRRKAVVLSDIWYLQNEAVHEHPVISLGGPGVNALSAALYRTLPPALAIEDVLLIQMDVTFEDRRACVWGMDHDRTKIAVATFAQHRFLGAYLDAMWQSLG